MRKLEIPFTLVFVLCMSFPSSGCSESTTRDDSGSGDSATAIDTGSSDSATPTDTGGRDTAVTDSSVDSGPLCVPVTCEIACMYGFARETNGCEICECAEPPDDSCTAGGECTLARDAANCCGCLTGMAAARVDREPCLVREGEPVPPGCAPDPEICATSLCEECQPYTGASCSGGACIGTMD